jgi:hypothetical protein
MNRKRLIGSIAAACAAAALTAGIAEGSATTQSSGSTQSSTTSSAAGAPGHGAAGGGPGAGGPGGGPGMQPVHSVSVVLDKAKTAYLTQTSDRGTIESVDSGAGTIAILEGTKSVTYKSATVDVPSGATITLDGKTSTLSALVAGDRVSVSSSSDGTVVMAMDSSFRPEGGPGTGPAKGQMPPGEGSSGSTSTSSTTTSG